MCKRREFKERDFLLKFFIVLLSLLKNLEETTKLRKFFIGILLVKKLENVKQQTACDLGLGLGLDRWVIPSLKGRAG
jgi:hypothetical protein